MKQYKIWLVLLFSFVIGCGNGQNADEEKLIENTVQTETLKQEENVTQAEAQKQEKSVTKADVSKDSGMDELVYTFEDLENITDIAVTDDGRLYVTCFQEMKQEYKKSKGKELLVITQPTQWLFEFDSDGTCVCFGEMLYSPGKAMVLEWSEDSLYMVVPGVNGMPVLYQVEHLSEVHSDVVETYKELKETDADSNNYIQELLAFYDLEMWTVQELYRFNIFSEINQLVFLGDRLYVQGTLANSEENSFVQNTEFPEMHLDTDMGQAIGYLDMKNLDAGVTLLSVDGIPQDMIKFDENTLGIYLAREAATSLWKYTPAKETWEQTDIAAVKYSETEEASVSYSKFAAYEDGCFYVKDGNVVCYKTVAGAEQELFESDGSVKVLKTDGMYLYYYSDEWAAKEVRRIGISGLLEGETE